MGRTVGVVIAILAMFGSPVFFGTMALLGLSYGGAEASSSFIVYSVAVAVAALATCVVGLLTDEHRYPWTGWMAWFLTAFVVISYLVVWASGSTDAGTDWVFRNYLVWSVPAFSMGFWAAARGRWLRVQRYLDGAMIFFSVVGLRVAVDLVLNGWVSTAMGGTTYQTLSYVTALAFGLNIYLLLGGEAIGRPSFAGTRAYHLLCVVLIPIQLLCVAISGGRGGMVLAIVYGLVGLLRWSRVFKKRGKRRVVILMLLLAWVALQLSLSNSAVATGYGRVFAYVTGSGIDWAGTSGRDVLYRRALDTISSRPVLGYGMFGYLEDSVLGSYPHNMFLEFLLGGGAVGLALALILMAAVIARYRLLSRLHPDYGLVGVLAIFPLVMLQFSGTFLTMPTLWFVLGLVLSSDVREGRQQVFARAECMDQHTPCELTAWESPRVRHD